MHTLLLLLLSASPGTISGRVLDTDGDPVANAKVELRDQLSFDTSPGTDKVAHATTDATGSFTATLDFRPTMARVEAAEYSQAGASWSDDYVTISANRAVTLRKLRKNAHARVTGSVVDETGAPLEGAMVQPAGDMRRNYAFTDSAGNFTIVPRRDERVLRIYRKGYVAREVPTTKGPMKVVLVRRPTLAVYLVDASGQPVRGIQPVEARKPDGSRISQCGTRDIAGDCTLEAELGEVTVTSTVKGKTVKQVVRVENGRKLDVTLRF